LGGVPVVVQLTARQNGLGSVSLVHEAAKMLLELDAKVTQSALLFSGCIQRLPQEPTLLLAQTAMLDNFYRGE